MAVLQLAAISIAASAQELARLNLRSSSSSRSSNSRGTGIVDRSSSLTAAHPAGRNGFGRSSPARHRRDSAFCTSSGIASGATVQDVKFALMGALEGVNRGIFGVPSEKKVEIEDLLKALEALNPSPRPTENLDTVKGEWRLLYSTISILGVKRTKLGLRDFVTLGEFLQIIDVEQNTAVNKIGFNVAGLGMLKGALTIKAVYHVTSPTVLSFLAQKASLDMVWCAQSFARLDQEAFRLFLNSFYRWDETHLVVLWDVVGNAHFLRCLISSWLCNAARRHPI